MTWLKIQSSITQIDYLFAKASSLNSDAEVLAHWARYLCVRCAGLLERSAVTMVSDYCHGQCSPNVNRYVQKQLKWFQNATPGKVSELFGSFNERWPDQIESFWQDRHKSSIASILANRHKIAHGEDSDITVGRLRPWYNDQKEVIGFLHNLLFPETPPPRR